MRLTVKEKQKATRITAARYQKASKKKKGAILDEFIALSLDMIAVMRRIC